jgi:hypothetical protein
VLASRQAGRDRHQAGVRGRWQEGSRDVCVLGGGVRTDIVLSDGGAALWRVVCTRRTTSRRIVVVACVGAGGGYVHWPIASSLISFPTAPLPSGMQHGGRTSVATFLTFTGHTKGGALQPAAGHLLVYKGPPTPITPKGPCPATIS